MRVDYETSLKGFKSDPTLSQIAPKATEGVYF